MKKIVIACVVALALAGCSAEKYGSGVDAAASKVKVKDIILYPEMYGKKVTLEGKITTQCMSNGCWFFLQDDTGQIYVNLAPNNFSLPANIGRLAKVTGVVYANQEGYQLVAQGVELN